MTLACHRCLTTGADHMSQVLTIVGGNLVCAKHTPEPNPPPRLPQLVVSAPTTEGAGGELLRILRRTLGRGSR